MLLVITIIIVAACARAKRVEDWQRCTRSHRRRRLLEYLRKDNNNIFIWLMLLVCTVVFFLPRYITHTEYVRWPYERVTLPLFLYLCYPRLTCRVFART